MKKITAIVLCVLLAMSALVVLTACGTTEYVVSFREYNSKIIYQGKTINGKAVEPKAPTKEGYDFKGWYKTLTATVDGDGKTVYNFADEMDFDKAVDGDLDLYAKYEVSAKPAPSSNPYYVVGSFAGDSWNGNGVADLNRMLKPVDGVLTATFTVLPGVEFKLKYADVGWHDDLDVAFGALKGVTLAEGVELTDTGVTKAEDLFVTGNPTEPAKGNIKLADAVVTANKQVKIKLTYVESNKAINIEVLDISDAPVVDDSCPSGYRVVGVINGADVWNSNDGAYKMAQDENNKSIYTKTLTLKAGEQLKVKENLFKTDGSANWDGKSFGVAAIDKVTLDTGVTLPTGVTEEQLFTGSDNIEVGVDCEITLTLDYATKKLTILVTAIG